MAFSGDISSPKTFPRQNLQVFRVLFKKIKGRYICLRLTAIVVTNVVMNIKVQVERSLCKITILFVQV